VLNGQIQRVRERIPTPESDNRLNGVGGNSMSQQTNPFSNIQSIATGVALTAQNLASNPSIFSSSNNMPILGTLLLSPINEADSVNNTLTSSSLAQSTSLIPFNVKSTNTQFGSLVIPTNSSHDQDSTNSSSFVVIPTTMTENEIIPVSITSMPLSITTTNHSTTSGAIITELPLEQSDSSSRLQSTPTTPRLGHLFDSPALSEHRVHRQQSLDSNRSAADNSSGVSSNSNNATTTTTKRNGKKHSEVYV
jgi:hypothetical protein